MMFNDPKQKRLTLKKVAWLLTTGKAIEHPCNVALAKYNLAEKEIKYDTLFSDWNLTACHYSFPATEFKVRVDSFIKMTEGIEQKPNHSKALRMARTDTGGREAFLRSVASELQKTVFHLPVTDVLYKEAHAESKMWSGVPLQFHHRYSKYVEQRNKIEEQKGHVGHWEYGCSLECLYLCADINNYFGTYFIKRQGEEILLVAAFL